MSRGYRGEHPSLVQCPTCGKEVAAPTRSWPVFVKLNEENGKPQFSVGVFECPECKSKFRARVDAQPEPKATPDMGNLVERINSIRDGLNQSLNTLRVKLKMLETERSALLAEVDELKRTAESRADALEAEVSQLREEIKSMREVLSSG